MPKMMQCLNCSLWYSHQHSPGICLSRQRGGYGPPQKDEVMPKIATEPLRKVTLNLFEADVEWYQERYGQGWSEIMRRDIRHHVNHWKERAGEQ